MMGSKKWTRRRYELAALSAVRQLRSLVLFWARQCHKSTTLGTIAFDEMSREPGRTVTAASASLLLGSELVSKTVSATEQAAIVLREAAAVHAALSAGVTESAGAFDLKAADSQTKRVLKGLSAEDLAELYRTSRLEMRLYHSKTDYSRLLIIAPSPATARGWTGTVIRDEAGFTRPSVETELRIAVKPIMDTDPTFKMIQASNLPSDDRHPFFEDTMPPPDMEFIPDAQGHFYRSQNGGMIHRVALEDAYAAGHVLYDTQTGKPLTYDQFCADPANKLGLDVSYRLIHQFGGAAAITLPAIMASQRRGASLGAFRWIEDEGDMIDALRLLTAQLGDGTVGIGYDVATTTGDTSNPSSLTFTEKQGNERIQRLVAIWKTDDPRVAIERLRLGVDAVKRRPRGGPARGLAVDASNELNYARSVRYALQGELPVELIMGGKTVEPPIPNVPKQPNYKTLLGDNYSTLVNEGHYSLPSADYLKDDHRIVLKVAGQYKCDPEPDGRHGDTFDSGKLAEWMLESHGGAITDVRQIHMGSNLPRRRFRPRQLIRT